MSTNPYDNELEHIVTLDGNHKTLGFVLEKCPIRQLPQLQRCLPGTPSARIPKWRSTLKHSYIPSINDTPINNIREFEDIIKTLRKQKKHKVHVFFGTMRELSLPPESGISQLYFDQLRSIANHMSDIRNGEETIN